MTMVSMNVMSVCFYFKYKCMHLNAFNVCKPCNVWIMWYAIVLVAVMTPWALKTLEAEKMPSIKISIACPQKCDIWANTRHTFHDYTRFSPHFLSWFNNNNSKKKTFESAYEALSCLLFFQFKSKTVYDLIHWTEPSIPENS